MRPQRDHARPDRAVLNNRERRPVVRLGQGRPQKRNRDQRARGNPFRDLKTIPHSIPAPQLQPRPLNRSSSWPASPSAGRSTTLTRATTACTPPPREEKRASFDLANPPPPGR